MTEPVPGDDGTLHAFQSLQAAEAAGRAAVAAAEAEAKAARSEAKKLASQVHRQQLALMAVTDTLSATVAALGEDASVTVSDMQYFAVSFGAEAIGMIVVIKAEGVLVGELRSGVDGTPLAAKACGRINEGDHVVAVNERCLLPHTSLEEVSREFSEASRPVRVLFRRPVRSVAV